MKLIKSSLRVLNGVIDIIDSGIIFYFTNVILDVMWRRGWREVVGVL